MRTYTFKVIPDPPEPKKSKAAVPSPQPEESAPCLSDGNCPPKAPYAPKPPMPPYGQMPPFESIIPPMPNPPFPAPFPFPGPDPVVPVMPGYSLNMRLAHAYVPWQFFAMVYNPAEALANGTLFPELNMPQGEYGPCEGPKPCLMVFPRGGASDAQE